MDSVSASLSIDDREVWSYSMSDGLKPMAEAAGLYQVIWNPHELGFTHACQCIPALTSGVVALALDRMEFEEFNHRKDLYTYDDLLRFAQYFLNACRTWPMASVR